MGQDVALYAEKSGVLYIEVADGATGKMLWSKPAAPGGVAPGVVLEPAIVNGKVVYLRPSRTSMFTVRVVAADPATGADVAVSSQSLLVTDRPAACLGQACFTARRSTAVSGLRMDVHTGTVSVDPARAGLAARNVGPDGLLSVHGSDAAEQLARESGGRILWKHPLADLFGPGYSTNYGWHFNSLDQRNLVVVTVGAAPPGGQNSSTFALGSGKMVGINLATGTRTWQQTGGLDLSCIPAAAVTANSALAAVRCRWGKSTILQRNSTTNAATLRAASAAVEGFDLRTGNTTWTVPLADPSGLSFQDWLKTFKVAGQQTLVVKGPRGLLTVDPVTGATATATALTTVTCTQVITTAILGADQTVKGTAVNSYVTGFSLHSCTTAGAPAALTGSWPT